MKNVSSQLKPLLLLAGLAVLLAGCKDQSVRVYQIPKELPKAPTAMAASPATAGPARPHLHWDAVPDTWTERPAEGMRAADFAIVSEDGLTAEVGAIPMPLMAGREMAIVNMWREQLNLSATNVVSDLHEDAVIAGAEGQLFDFTSDELLVDGRHRQRVVVAMLSQNNTTWFMKLTGPAELVEKEKPNFLQWLKNVEIDESSHGTDAPVTASAMPATGGGGAPGGRPQWEIPSDWQATDAGPMLLAAFALPGGGKVTVSSLGGDGGGLLPNINRWRGQLGLTPITESQLGEVSESIQTPDGTATLVDLQGADQKMLAIILPHAGQTWFYKSMGPVQSVSNQREAFLNFARTAQH